MYTVKADIKKNRLYVKLEGFFEHKEMKAATDKTILECKKLKPGFDVINDISDFKAVGQDTLDEVKRGQAFFKKAGIRHGLRVAGKAAALTASQFNRIGKTVDYVTDTVETMAEAEKILNS